MRHHGKLNGELKGTIEGDDFVTALLRVWLGAKRPPRTSRTACWVPADRALGYRPDYEKRWSAAAGQASRTAEDCDAISIVLCIKYELCSLSG